ncbi:MAG: helix-turn-helix domain-containing protein [Candidatus Cryosericum sp.]
MPEVLTVKETAKLLRCSEAKVYELCETGHLVHFRLGKPIRIPADAVEAFIHTPPPKPVAATGRGWAR